MSKVMPRSSPACAWAAKKACMAASVPAVAVWSFSITSSTCGAACNRALRRCSEACDEELKRPIDIFRRGARNTCAACTPRARAASSSAPCGVHRPSGLEYTAARPASAGSSVAASRSSSPRTSTPSAPACWARSVHHSWPWRPVSAAPKEDREINTFMCFFQAAPPRGEGHQPHDLPGLDVRGGKSGSGPGTAASCRAAAGQRTAAAAPAPGSCRRP